MFVHSPRNHTVLLTDLGIALTPACIWAVFLFGGRAAVLLLLCGLACAGLDVPSQLLRAKLPIKRAFPCRYVWEDTGFAFLTGVLCAFWFPVTVPLWMPLLAAVPITLFRAAFVYFGHRPFNASIAAALLMHLSFPQYMQRFTRPFAYFPIFPGTVRPELAEAYRVTTPLDLLWNGRLYEDGKLAQLYGFASGGIGAVAIACLLMGGVWLLLRRLLSVYSTGAYVLTVMVIAMSVAPAEAEMFRYSLLHLLSGGIALVAVFGVNDPATLPRSNVGKAIFGAVAGILTMLFRCNIGGPGELYVLALTPLLTPALEWLLRPHDYYFVRKKAHEE